MHLSIIIIIIIYVQPAYVHTTTSNDPAILTALG